MSAERRKHRRFTLSKRARVILGPIQQESSGQLVDLSANGASLTTEWAITAGVGVFVTFAVGGRSCEATGHVVRVFPFGAVYGVAVEFGVANEEFYEFLRELDRAHEAARPDMLGAIEQLCVHVA